MTRTTLIVIASLLVASAHAGAQKADPKAKKGAEAAPAAPVVPAGPPPPTPPPNFKYSAEGRRDPFLSLFNRGTDAKAQQVTRRAEGVPGLLTGELVVRGIIQTRGVWVAMVNGADGKVYSIRAGDRIADGVIRNVTAQAVVILQEVNDPLSLEKQREVRKLLRGGEEVK
jgi:Tfp pilus assembly protein PilP